MMSTDELFEISHTVLNAWNHVVMSASSQTSSVRYDFESYWRWCSHEVDIEMYSMSHHVRLCSKELMLISYLLSTVCWVVNSMVKLHLQVLEGKGISCHSSQYFIQLPAINTSTSSTSIRVSTSTCASLPVECASLRETQQLVQVT